MKWLWCLDLRRRRQAATHNEAPRQEGRLQDCPRELTAERGKDAAKIDNDDTSKLLKGSRAVVQVRNEVLAYLECKLHAAGISFCVFGRLAAMKYGCPLAAHHEEFLQLAVEDGKMERIAEMFAAGDKKLRPMMEMNSRWAGVQVNGVFLESLRGGIHVELLPAYSTCCFPAGTFDRVVAFEGRAGSSPLPSLADLLVSLDRALLEPNQELIGKSFASMLVDVYRLEPSWIIAEVSPLDKEVGDEFVYWIERQRSAYYRTKPTGWVLHKFFTNGNPFQGKLYLVGVDGNGKGALPPVLNWPPPRRNWKIFDDEPVAGCFPSQNNSGTGAGSSGGVSPGADEPAASGDSHNGDNEEESNENGDQGDESDVPPGDDNTGESGPVAEEAEPCTPKHLLLAAALRCQNVLAARGIFFAFVGGFALQQIGMKRETHDVDFAYEGGYRDVRDALNTDECFTQVPVAADGAFRCFCTVVDTDSGENVAVEINGLNSSEYGGPSALEADSTFRSADGVVVGSPVEILSMKMNSIQARDTRQDQLDMEYLIVNHGDDMSYNVVRVQYRRVRGAITSSSLREAFEKWATGGESSGFALPSQLYRS